MMKKIVILFFALLLTLSSISYGIAEENEPATFDFTLEEWLERYQAVVEESSPYYIAELNEDLPSADRKMLIHGQTIDDKPVTTWSSAADRKVIRISVRTWEPLFEYDEKNDETHRRIVENLCSAAKNLAIAALPNATAQEIDDAFTTLAGDGKLESLIKEPNVVNISGATMTLDLDTSLLLYIAPEEQ